MERKDRMKKKLKSKIFRVSLRVTQEDGRGAGSVRCGWGVAVMGGKERGQDGTR